MPSLTKAQERQLVAARLRATHTRWSLTEVAARFALAADTAPGRELEAVLDAVAVLLGDAAREHATKGHCLACNPGCDCPLVSVTDAFLPEGTVMA